MISPAPRSCSAGAGTWTATPAYMSCDSVACTAMDTPSTNSRTGTEGRCGAGSGPAITHVNR